MQESCYERHLLVAHHLHTPLDVPQGGEYCIKALCMRALVHISGLHKLLELARHLPSLTFDILQAPAKERNQGDVGLKPVEGHDRLCGLATTLNASAFDKPGIDSDKARRLFDGKSARLHVLQDLL